MTALCAQTGTYRRTRACLAYADGSCGPCGLASVESEDAVYADLYEPYARPVYDTASEDGSLAWLGRLLILLCAALALAAWLWLIVAVLT